MKKLFTIAIMALSINAFAQIPTNGLVGYWPFNGNANDESGNGNNGTVNGATLTTDRFGNTNSAFSFDGVNDYIMVADKDNLSLTSNNFTFSFWLYVNVGTNVNMGAIAKRKFDGLDASNWEYSFGVNANPNEFRCWFGNLQGNCAPYDSAVDVTFTKDQWTHYAVTANGTTIKFYKNGQLLSKGTRSQACNLGNGSGPLVFGLGGGWNQMYFLKGKMDEIRIYNRELSPSEISMLNTHIISVSALPTAGGTISGGGTLNYGSNASLTASPALGYKFLSWAEGSVVASTSATYSFVVDKNRALIANFISTVGIDDNSLQEIRIYPNPAQDILNIDFPSDNNAVVYIFDNAGQVLITTKERRINISHLAKGNYLVKIKERVFKLIKQ